MHREHRPRPRIAPPCATCKSRHGAPEPADRHAARLGVLGHVDCRGRTEFSSTMRERSIDRRERLAYAALIAAPLIDLASAAGWGPGAPLSTIAA